MAVDFNGRVVVITGAGGGLGREYALYLAGLGAKVVVNDLGVGRADDNADSTPADEVVAEIKAAGGEAVANYDSVADPEGAKRIIATAIDSYGQIDALINNAGILRDKSFGKTDLGDFAHVVQTHLLGTVYCTHAAWPHMVERKYGRVVVTTSIAGTAGNFGQTAYGAAKLGLVGFMNTLKIEGAKNNVLTNAISPGAITRMTAGLNPAPLEKYMLVEMVAPVVAYLASEACTTSGQIIEAMAGGISRLQYFQTEGVQFDPEEPLTVDMIADRFATIADLDTAKPALHGAEGLIEPRLRAIGRWEV